MKLLVSKEITGLTVDEISQFLEKLSSDDLDFDVVLFDSNLEEPSRYSELTAILISYASIGLVRSEKDDNLMELSLTQGVDRECAAFLHIPKNVNLNKNGSIVDVLFSEMSDSNIHATFCDYSQNGVLLIQNRPVIFCQRITNRNNSPLNVMEIRGIVKYIPLELYNVC